jgi:hypothetical protein
VEYVDWVEYAERVQYAERVEYAEWVEYAFRRTVAGCFLPALQRLR